MEKYSINSGIFRKDKICERSRSSGIHSAVSAVFTAKPASGAQNATHEGYYYTTQPMTVALRLQCAIIIPRGGTVDKYTVLIADISRSRSYSVEARNSIQKYLVDLIFSLNKVFSDSLVKAVEFSAGDEIQGLFLAPQPAYLYLRLLSMFIHPAEIRAGIGVGEWSVKIENASTTAQDGPVYHNSRCAINKTSETEGYHVLICSGSKNDLFLNVIINVPFLFAAGHSGYQNEIMLLTELMYPISYNQAISQNNVGLLFRLARLRTRFDFFSEYRRKSRSSIIFDTISFPRIWPDPVDAAEDEGSFYVSGGRVWGMTTHLSEILGVSRQSVEKTLRAGNIYAARNSAIAALKSMGRFL